MINKKKILITGEQGFVGSLLLKRLTSLGHDVQGFTGDICDEGYCQRRVAEVDPSVVIHLAALSLPQQCNDQPVMARSVNVQGTQNLIEAVSASSQHVHFIFSSTVQVYESAALASGRPVDEQTKIHPQNLYAQTKWDAEKILNQSKYHKNIRTTVLRLFNHVHKSQQSATFMSSIYDQMLKIKNRGEHSGEVVVGNLDLFRELNPVQILLKVFAEVVVIDPDYSFNVFNVCSGQSRKLESVAHEMAKFFNLELKFVTDPKLMRATDPKVVVGNNQLMSQLLHLNYPLLTDRQVVESFCSDLVFV